MRTLIHKLKYQDRHETISLFALWLEQAGQEFIPKTDLIIPIPLHSSRLWTRRFNQSTLIAKRLGQRTGLPVATTLLKRAKKTHSQVGLSAKERKTNMSGAFAISEEKKHLLEKIGIAHA